MSSYCNAIANMKDGDREVHRRYHDHYYGFPIATDDELFCRLILEINQAGLSWTTILKKEPFFRKAYQNFNIKKVAKYGEKDFNRLMADAGIIRNRLKITAAIENAKTILLLQKEHGSFKNWLDLQHPKTKTDWVTLFKKTFRFTGGEIVNEFLMSTGYLAGAHHPDCKIQKQILKAKPAWLRNS
ncbi:MAG: DNA-3-methyladenine glycosylase I [Bacteroidota bacterium]|nr:DNA-3-methyladenine glycosylase I [Bacteroidota bacterium]